MSNLRVGDIVQVIGEPSDPLKGGLVGCICVVTSLPKRSGGQVGLIFNFPVTNGGFTTLSKQLRAGLLIKAGHLHISLKDHSEVSGEHIYVKP
jgi:hypothetical protein